MTKAVKVNMGKTVVYNEHVLTSFEETCGEACGAIQNITKIYLHAQKSSYRRNSKMCYGELTHSVSSHFLTYSPAKHILTSNTV